MRNALRQPLAPVVYCVETVSPSSWRPITVSLPFTRPGSLQSDSGKLTVFLVQLLPHAEHIIVLEDGRIREQGSFRELTASADSYVASLEIKIAAAQEIKAVVAQEWEQEKADTAIVLEKIVTAEAMSQESDSPQKKSRGKRNSDALFSYVKTMGKVQFPIFCAFTFCNIGFRSAQRTSPQHHFLPRDCDAY